MNIGTDEIGHLRWQAISPIAKIIPLTQLLQQASHILGTFNVKAVSFLVLAIGISLVGCDGSRQQANDPSSEAGMPPSQQPADLNAWLERADYYAEHGQFGLAAEDLAVALSLDSSALTTWHRLADAYLDGLQSRKALETMTAASRLFPDSLGTQLKLSEFQLILRRYNDALATLNSIQAKRPQSAEAYFMKAQVFKEMGDTVAAVRHYQYATRADAHLLDAWIGAGQLLAAQGESEALAYFDAGLVVAPDYLPLRHAKANVLGALSQFAAAKVEYRSMLEIDPDYSEAYYDLGLLYLDQDSLVLARNHFQLAITTEPLFGRAYFYRGLTSELLGDTAQATRDYQQVLQLNPADQDARNGLQRLGSL